MTTALLLALSCTAAQTKEYGLTFHHDFRGQPLVPPLAVLPWKHEAATIEKDGLRMLLPRGRKDLRQVGVISNLPVRGDFEITAAYHIVHADLPTEGWGVGVTLVIEKAEPSGDRAGIRRLVKPKGIQHIGWECANTPPGETRLYKSHNVPCDETTLRMRIKRASSMLSYSWAPGLEGEDFRALGTAEFGLDDVHAVVMNATTGGKPNELDARFLDLKIRTTDKSPELADPPSRLTALTDSRKPAPERRQRWWLLLSALVIGTLVFMTLLTWRLRRHRAQDEGRL